MATGSSVGTSTRCDSSGSCSCCDAFFRYALNHSRQRVAISSGKVSWTRHGSWIFSGGCVLDSVETVSSIRRSRGSLALDSDAVSREGTEGCRGGTRRVISGSNVATVDRNANTRTWASKKDGVERSTNSWTRSSRCRSCRVVIRLAEKDLPPLREAEKTYRAPTAHWIRQHL